MLVSADHTAIRAGDCGVHRLRDVDTAGFGKTFESGCDIHPVTIDLEGGDRDKSLELAYPPRSSYETQGIGNAPARRQ